MPIKLYKSSRLKGYLTLTFATLIHMNAANKSINVSATQHAQEAIPATKAQQDYSLASSYIGLIVVLPVLVVHFDRFTPLQRLWRTLFKRRSKFELLLAIFLAVWWSVDVGLETTITGVAGDGKKQFNLYFSAWACCISSYWILERWTVASGWSSLKQFITSWPYRAPGWLCILFLSFFTICSYTDLWLNHGTLNRTGEAYIKGK